MTDPLMAKDVKTLVSDIPKRFFGLICKLFSMKTAVFVVATILLLRQSLPTWAWLTIAVVVLLGREADKHLPALFARLVGTHVDNN